MNFKKVVDLKTSLLKISLFGFINENSEFGSYPFDGLRAVHLDCDGVELINSSGVKAWVGWLKTVLTKNPDMEFIFSNCPKVIIEQMNSVSGFLPKNSQIKSFYLPFLCEKCGTSQATRLVLGTDYEKDATVEKLIKSTPKLNCAKCNSPIEADFLPQKYFKFITIASR